MRDVAKSKSGLPFLDVFARCAEGIGGGKLIAFFDRARPVKRGRQNSAENDKPRII
jgi:hypothetical protein